MSRPSWAAWWKGWRKGIAFGALLLAGGWVLAGCPGPANQNAETPVTEEAPCPPLDPTAKLVTIQSDLHVDPPILGLSQGAMEAVQWFNASEDSVMVLLQGAPVGIAVPPHGYSAVHRVNPTIALGSYHYDVRKGASGPPDPPQIDIGP